MRETTQTRDDPSYGREHRTIWAPDGPARATIVLIHGIAEHAGRYDRTASLLAESGYEVIAPDLFGFGRSGGRRADIEQWSDYWDQVAALVDEARSSDGPVVLMGHSMGALIVASYVLADGTPRPDLVILSALPLTSGARWQRVVAPVAAKVAPKAQVPNKFDGSLLSRDPEVGERYHADPLVTKSTSARLGNELFKSQAFVAARMHAWAIPTLVMHGGADKIAPASSTAGLADLPPIERRLYPKLRHEILNEPEGPELVAEIVAWLDEKIAARARSAPEDEDLA